MFILTGKRGVSKFEQVSSDIELLIEKANYLISQGFTTRISRVRS